MIIDDSHVVIMGAFYRGGTTQMNPIRHQALILVFGKTKGFGEGGKGNHTGFFL